LPACASDLPYATLFRSDVGEAASAVLLGDHEVRDADLSGGAEDVDRRFGVGFVDAAACGPDRVRGEGPAQVEDVTLLIGQRPGGVAHGGSLSIRRGAGSRGPRPCARACAQRPSMSSLARERSVMWMRVGPSQPSASLRAASSSSGPSAWTPWAPMAGPRAGKPGPVSATPEGASPRSAISLRISPYPPLSTMIRLSRTCSWTAAASSAIVNIAPPSPSTAITWASGAAIAAPMPAGRP